MHKEYDFQDNMDYPEEKNPFDFFNSALDNEEKSGQKNKSYNCTFPGCGKVFRFKSEISRHYVIHFPDRSYQCEHPGCAKAFKRLDALETHIKTHAKIKRFICDYQDCKQKFASKAGLKYHILKHKDELPFKCTFPGCHKAFLTAICLDKHLKKPLSHSKISRQKEFLEEKFNSGINFDNSVASPDFQEIVTEKPVVEQNCEDSSDFSTQEKVQSLLESILKENQMMKQQLESFKPSEKPSPEIFFREFECRKHSSQMESDLMFDQTVPDPSPFNFMREDQYDFSCNF